MITCLCSTVYFTTQQQRHFEAILFRITKLSTVCIQCPALPSLSFLQQHSKQAKLLLRQTVTENHPSTSTESRTLLELEELRMANLRLEMAVSVLEKDHEELRLRSDHLEGERDYYKERSDRLQKKSRICTIS